jgi:hypothetical protein
MAQAAAQRDGRDRARGTEFHGPLPRETRLDRSIQYTSHIHDGDSAALRHDRSIAVEALPSGRLMNSR